MTTQSGRGLAGAAAMTTFVLVPGGWHGGWWLEPLARELRGRGHHAYPVTLTGLGDRHHLLTGSVNLDTHIHDVEGLLDYERLDDVVLVAHSYGGMVTTAVADRHPDRVKALVNIDAQVPRDGDSLWTMTTEAFRQTFIAAANDGVSVAPPRGLDPRVTPHPLASFIQPAHITGAYEQIDPKHFVFLAGWGSDSPLEPIYLRLYDTPGWYVQQLPAGHDFMTEAPQEILQLLLSLA